MKNILVVHKISKYQQHVVDEHDTHLERLVDAGDISVAQWRASHERHTQSLGHIIQTLQARKDVALTVRARDEAFQPDCHDLVVSVGGDGTVLDLSHQVSWTPVLAINSDPTRSVGYFCAGTAPEFDALLSRTLERSWQPVQLHRFFATIDGAKSPPVLNDILIAHANPAAVSSYIFRLDEREEAQRSSGIWLATSAGSTAAIRSAGGIVMPLKTRQIQFVVREPYTTSRTQYRKLRGICPEGTAIEVVSRMTHGRVYVDGPHHVLDFETGSRLRIDHDAPPLLLYGLDARRRTE